MYCKFILPKLLKRLTLKNGTSYEEFVNMIKNSDKTIKHIQYQDEEGDWILIESKEDWEEAQDVYKKFFEPENKIFKISGSISPVSQKDIIIQVAEAINETTKALYNFSEKVFQKASKEVPTFVDRSSKYVKQEAPKFVKKVKNDVPKYMCQIPNYVSKEAPKYVKQGSEFVQKEVPKYVKKGGKFLKEEAPKYVKKGSEFVKNDLPNFVGGVYGTLNPLFINRDLKNSDNTTVDIIDDFVVIDKKEEVEEEVKEEEVKKEEEEEKEEGVRYRISDDEIKRSSIKPVFKEPEVKNEEPQMTEEEKVNVLLLIDMGFEKEKSLELLRKHKNNVQNAVSEYLNL